MRHIAKNAYSVQEALHEPFDRIQTGVHIILILTTANSTLTNTQRAGFSTAN